MKVAVYFSGHLRTYDKTWENWKKYVIDPLNADVFIATWPHIGSWVSKGIPVKPDPNDIGTVRREELIDVKSIINLLNPKKIEVLDEHEFEEQTTPLLKEVCEWRDSLSNKEYWGYMPRSHISQYYTWKRVDDLRKTYEVETSISYDIIIRARTDLLIENFLDPFHLQLENILLTQVRNDINEPLWINDIMFLGTTNVISNVCKLYDSYSILFDTLKKSNSPEWFFSSHKLISYYLLSTGCPWLEVTFPFKRFNHGLIR